MADRNQKEKKKQSGASRVLSTIIIICAAVVLVISGYKLFTLWQEYHAGTVEYNQVAEEVIKEEEETPEVDPTQRGDGQWVPEIDWDTLLAKNSDVVGWIRFPQPEVINYPVVYCSDNDYYLHHTLELTYLFSGCIFIDMNNVREMTDANTIVYGHNMDDGSMFGELDKYRKEEFFNENQYFYFQTPDGGAYKYQVLAFYETLADSESYKIGFDSREQYQAFQEACQAQSMYASQAQINPDAPMLTLSTCTNRAEDGRYLLQGILVETIKEGTTARQTLNWGVQ